jgi:hypothetical protein
LRDKGRDAVEEDTVAAAAASTSASDDWKVVVAELHDRGNAANGVQTSVLVHGKEAEARRVYADAVAVAAERGYEYVKLRAGGHDVDSWPPLTGWTC